MIVFSMKSSDDLSRMEIIERCTQPLIGLQHVHEYWSDVGHPIYWCGLCDASCGSSMHVVVVHVATPKHRINYMKLNYLSYYALIEDKACDPAALLEYARIIETDEGRKSVRVCEGPIPSIVLRARELSEDCTQEFVRTGPINFGEASIGQALHRIAMTSGAKTVGTMLQQMVPTLITNDAEAAKALEAANHLTRALLEYRLNGDDSSS